LSKSRLVIRSITRVSPIRFQTIRTHLNGDALPIVAVTGALLGAGIVNMPLSSNTVFAIGTGTPFPFIAAASSLCCAPLPPTDLLLKLNGPGLFFFPTGPGVTAGVIPGAGVGAGATMPLPPATADASPFSSVTVVVATGALEPGIGAGLVGRKLGPIIGRGSGSGGGGGARALAFKPRSLKFLFLRTILVAMLLIGWFSFEGWYITGWSSVPV
jgi:hypothetical protein